MVGLMYLYKYMKIRGKIQTTVRFALPPISLPMLRPVFLCPGQLTVDGIATLVTNCGITDFCSESAEGWGALVQRVFFNDWFVVDFTVVFQEPLKNKDRRKQKSFADLYFYQYRLWPKNWFCQSYGTYDSSGNWATYDSYAIETCID